MATQYLNLLPADARNTLNKIVFVVFTPSLMFACLAETVTLDDIISWWFMPINIGITFLIGGILGWLTVKILKPSPHLEGIIIASCSSGNLGNLLLIIVPAICTENGSPFGDHRVCTSNGLSYSSFSMAVGGFYIWTYTYQLIRSSSMRYKALKASQELVKEPNKDLEANEETRLLNGQAAKEELESQTAIVYGQEPDNNQKKENATIWNKFKGLVFLILEELTAPPTLGAILGFVFGAISWLKDLVIGENAPLRVIQDSVKLLGNATIPCITLILGGNLIQGLQKATLKPIIIVSIILVRFLILPIVGIGVERLATNFGLLPSDPLFHFVLMVQFTLPPAMNIGTMTQLFDVGQAECSVIFLWTYVVAALALTAWSTVYMWILS